MSKLSRRTNIWSITFLTMLASSLVPFPRATALTALVMLAPFLWLVEAKSSPVPQPRWLRNCFLAGGLGGAASAFAYWQGVQSLVGAVLVPLGFGLLVSLFLRVSRGELRAAGIAMVAVVVSQAAYYVLYPTAESVVDPWKYAFGVPTTLVAGALAGRFWQRGLNLASAAVLLGMGVANVLMGSRSLGGICAAVSVYIVLTGFSWKGVRGVILTLCIIGGLGYVAAHAYTAAASAGTFGQAQQQKIQFESSTRAGVLVSSRPELVDSLTAISRNPLLGYGPKAEVPPDVRDLALSRAQNLGLPVDAGQEQRLFGSGLNAHSIIFGAWVEGGVLAAVPWFACVVLFLATIWRGRVIRSWVWPLVCLAGTLATWDLFFSPWSPHYAVLLASEVGACVVLLREVGNAPTAPCLPPVPAAVQ